MGRTCVFAAGYYLCAWITPTVTLISGVLMVIAGGRIALQIGREGATSSARLGPTATR